MKKINFKHTRFYCFGLSTLSLLLVLLCTTSVAALSQLTAYQRYEKQIKEADELDQSNRAVKEAYLILSEIDRRLADAYQSTHTKQFYYLWAESELSALSYGTFEKNEQGYTYRYEVPIDDLSYIEITLEICYPTNPDETFYTINTWKTLQKRG